MSNDSKHIFGAYLNMARHNAFIILSHISKCLGATKEGDEANLPYMKAITILKTGKPEEKEKAVKMLVKHFPFLNPMADNEISRKDSKIKAASPDTYHDILEKIFNVLNSLRNQHSHYIYIDDREEEKKRETDSENKELVYYLKNCFNGARQVSKKRFGFSDSDMTFLTGSREGDRYYKDGRSHKERDDFAYKLDTENKMLSRQGILFLICLLIEKKYATMLLDAPALGFFQKNTPELKKKIIREIFTVYRMCLPKERMDSENPRMALGLDMLNELKKCPDELFETLSKEDRDKFRIKPEDAADSDNTEILMKRYQDRFPYYAMRYFDDNELFNNIRFQVSLGKYRYGFYNKKGIDSDKEDRVRILQKELNGFGRLNQIEERRRNEWKDLIRPYEEIRPDTAGEKPYITDHRANYIVNGNRIAMAFNSGERAKLRSGCFIPELNEKETRCIEPDCWMSIYELKAMVFHSLLCDREDKQETESLITDYVGRYRKLFSDIKEEKLTPQDEVAGIIKERYELDLNVIPEKLQDYLTGKSVNIRERFDKLTKERIDGMISWSERSLKRLKDDLKIVGDRKKNKIGTNRYVDIRPGRLARFLSEDILMMQPTEDQGKDKLTGMNFQIMQSSLAIYDKSLDELKRMFVSAGLIRSNIAHPFLEEVLKKEPKDTICFYRIYLEERIGYLKGITPGDYKKCNFVYAGRQKWAERDDSYYKELAGRYLNQPVELPRGLFNEDIKKKLQSKYSADPGLIDSLSRDRCNVSFLIAEFFRHKHADENQNFYTYKRTYDIFNTLKDKRTGKDLFKSRKEYYLSLDDMISESKNIDKSIPEDHPKYQQLCAQLSRFKKNEKIIRQYKVQDILLYLMAKDILIRSEWENNEMDEIEGYKLKNISPEYGDNSILSLQIPFSISLKMADGSVRTIRQEALKLKNYGDFFRFIYDQRIKALLPQVKSVEILDRQKLEKELERYDLIRTPFFELLLEFEKSIVCKNPELKKEKHDFKRILKVFEAEKDDKEHLRLIRNAFCHNNYPEDIKQFNVKDTIPGIADSLVDSFRGKAGM